jgi:2-hydroxymuconate-semialdehyde hydrolase
MHETYPVIRGRRYRLVVDGQGPVLLLVHGIGPGTTASANFASVWSALRERWTLVAPDLLGFGQSDLPPGDRFSPEAWDAQLLDVVSGLDAPRLAVMGQSIGGTLALRLAAREPRVAAVVTSGAAGGMSRAPEALRRFWRPPLTREAFAQVLAESFFDPSVLTAEQVDQRLTLMQSGAAQKFDALLAGDLDGAVASTRLQPAVLQAVSCPVLLIHGREDRQVPIEPNALALRAELPRAHLLDISGCGHNPLREHTALCLAAATAHLEHARGH